MARATEEELAEVRGHLEYIANIDVDYTVARPELGTINFSDGRDVFKEAKRLAQEWSSFPLELGTPAVLGSIKGQFENIHAAIEAVRSFSLEGAANPGTERDQLLATVVSNLDKAENALFTLRPGFAVLAADFREPLSRANELIADAKAEVKVKLEAVNELREEIEGVLRTVRDAAKREGIQNFAPHFSDLATENADESIKWLKAAGGAGRRHRSGCCLSASRIPREGLNRGWWAPLEPPSSGRCGLAPLLRHNLVRPKLSGASTSAHRESAPTQSTHDLSDVRGGRRIAGDP